MSLVQGRGNPDARILFIGEKPGIEELKGGEVWCGRVGRELQHLMWKYGLPKDEIWFDNLLQDAPTGDDWSVTNDDIQRNQQHIRSLLDDSDWDVVVALGAVATRHILGTGVRSQIKTVHAIPHDTDKFVVFPTFHPAAGLRDADSYPGIAYDFELLSRYLRGSTDSFPDRVDRYPKPHYVPLIDHDVPFIRHYFERRRATNILIDTEGGVRSPWCVTWTDAEGVGYLIRSTQRGALAALGEAIRSHKLVVWLHYAVHDLPVLRAMNIRLVEDGVKIMDTMVMAYLLQVEPQGLKNLAYRHCGMEMMDYMDTVGPYDLDLKVEYLLKAMEVNWGKPEPVLLEEKMGSKLTQPKSLNVRIESILNKVLNEGEERVQTEEDEEERVDVGKMWEDVYPSVRAACEEKFGPMPSATMDCLPFEDALYYACRDADATCRVHAALLPKIKALDLERTLEMDCATIPMIEEMQTTGFKADVEHFKRLTVKWRGEQGKIRWKIREMIGYTLNPESDKQVRQLLFYDLKLPSTRKTDSGLESTNDKAIDWMRPLHPVVPLICVSREYEKGDSSFASPITEYALADPDHRVHTNLKYTRVVSGRYSATDPNLLAMPVRTEMGKEIRNGFVADDGHLLGSWDLNQIEMRFMAHESGDEDLISAYLRDADIHKETAAKMFGISVDRVTDEERDPAKRVSFGVITGITGSGLKDQFYLNGITKYDEDDCDNLIKAWFDARPGVKNYLEGCKAETRRNRYVRESVGGRIRYLQGVHSTSKRRAAEHERASHSHRISSGAQAILKLAMARLWPVINELRSDGSYIKWILQVHDELIFEFDKELAEVLNVIITEALCNTVKLRVPIKAKGKWDRSWGRLK